MKKKYIVVLVSIIISLILGFIFFKLIGGKEKVFEETKERASEDYRITSDFVLVNTSHKSNNSMNKLDITTTESNLTLTSPVFVNQGSIPSKYTCDGDNISPVFEITGVSEKAKSLVFIMDDPDAPTEIWTHWIKFNIPVETQEISEGKEPAGISGEGTGGGLKYFGPCPPENEHRYIFKLYSLDTELTLPEGSKKEEVEEAMKGHILQTAKLVGKYERINK